MQDENQPQTEQEISDEEITRMDSNKETEIDNQEEIDDDDVDLNSSPVSKQINSPRLDDTRSESDSVLLDEVGNSNLDLEDNEEENKKEPSDDNVITVDDNENINENNIECVSISSSEEDGKKEEGMNDQNKIIENVDDDDYDDDESSDEDYEEEFTLESDEEEEYNPSYTTKRMHKLIDELIPTVSVGGSFSVGGELETYPAIGLQLIVPNTENNTVGRKHVSLPLVTKQQAEDIIQLAAKAPYGRGEETIIDENVRKTWQLEPNQFQIMNPNWEDMIDELVSNQVKKGLGVGNDKEIGFNLYKLLLYEEDSHFKFHRDSEKEENMFATLVVHLPSIYTGGELIVKHKSNEATYDYSSKSSYATSYVSFYCDCEHKVNRVTSGYRLALVYNIFFEGPSHLTPNPDSNEDVIQYMYDTLNIWESTPYIIHILEHKYTQDGISVGNLKGADARVFRWFESFNSIRDEFYLCVGQLHKEVTGDLNSYSGYRGYRGYSYSGYSDSDEENDGEEVDSDEMEEKEVYFHVKNLKDRTGSFSTSFNSLEKSLIIPYTSLLEIPHLKSSIEHTGNAGVNASKFYTSACMVIIPKKTFSTLLDKLDESCKTRYFNMVVDNQVKNPSIANIKKITDIISSNYLPEQILMNTIQKVQHIRLAEAISKKHISNTSWEYLISKFGLKRLKNQYFHYTISNLTGNRKPIAEGSLQTILSQNDPTLVSDLCNQVFESLSKVQGNNYCDFIQKILTCMTNFAIALLPNTPNYMADRCKTADPNEVIIILKYLESFPDTIKSVLGKLVSHKECFTKNCGTIVGCFKTFYDESIQNSIEPTLRSCISSNQVSSLMNYCAGLTDNPGALYIASYLRTNITQQFMNNTRDVDLESCKSIISMICKNGMPNDLSTFTSVIISKITDLEKVVKILIPLIQFIETSFGRSIFSTQPAFALFVHCTIGYFGPILKKQKEANVNNWTLPTINCTTNCLNCQKVNIFLQDVDMRTFEVREPQGVRNHVEQNLRFSKYLQLNTVKIGSPHRLIITKTSNPRLSFSNNLQKTITLMSYLKSLLANTQAPRPSSTDISLFVQDTPTPTQTSQSGLSSASSRTPAIIISSLLANKKRAFGGSSSTSNKKR